MSGFDTHANLIKVTVTAAPSPATSGTTLAISDTDRTALINAGLAAPFNMSAQPSSGASETNTEILRVTAIGAASSYNAGNTQLTVTRNTETTPGGARSIVVGDYLTLDISKKTIVDIETQVSNNQTLLSDLANYVHSGLTIPTSATLSATCAAGVIFYGGLYISVASDGGHTYTSSQDTYVDVDNTGAYHYSGVANGATAPALTVNSIRIAKVVTSGTAVTTVTQQGRDSLFNLIYPNSPEKNIYQTNYKFRAHLSANQSIPAATFTKVTLDTIDYDPSSSFDGATNHRFTVPYSGFYFVHVKTIFVAPATGTRMLIDIYKNGASAEEMQSVTNTTNDQGTATLSILQLNAGDYLEMYLYHNNSVAESVYGGGNTTYMEGHLLSI